jgi:hypothetical protein
MSWLRNLFKEPIYETLIDGKLYTTKGAIKLYEVSGIRGIDTLVTETVWKLFTGEFLERTKVDSCKATFRLLSRVSVIGIAEHKLLPREALKVVESI